MRRNSSRHQERLFQSLDRASREAESYRSFLASLETGSQVLVVTPDGVFAHARVTHAAAGKSAHVVGRYFSLTTGYQHRRTATEVEAWLEPPDPALVEAMAAGRRRRELRELIIRAVQSDDATEAQLEAVYKSAKPLLERIEKAEEDPYAQTGEDL